jgi:hypothetical protein
MEVNFHRWKMENTWKKVTNQMANVVPCLTSRSGWIERKGDMLTREALHILFVISLSKFIKQNWTCIFILLSIGSYYILHFNVVVTYSCIWVRFMCSSTDWQWTIAYLWVHSRCVQLHPMKFTDTKHKHICSILHGAYRVNISEPWLAKMTNFL